MYKLITLKYNIKSTERYKEKMKGLEMASLTSTWIVRNVTIAITGVYNYN